MNSDKSLISVVIPAYNRGYIIRECIESVLRQTYQNIEVIVVDDCSTDNTVSVVKSIKDPRVQCYLLKKNSGACFARNYGVKQSSGVYIAFQDSDDVWKEDKLEKQLEFIENSGADFVFCGMNRNDPLNNRSTYYPSDFSDKNDILAELLENNAISTQTILLRRACMEEIQFDITFRRYQDWDFAIQAAAAGFKMAYMPYSFVNSTIQQNSISATVKSGEAYIHLMDKHKELYEKYPHARAIMCKKIGNSFWAIDQKKAFQFYKDSLKAEFSVKVFVKMILCRIYKSREK